MTVSEIIPATTCWHLLYMLHMLGALAHAAGYEFCTRCTTAPFLSMARHRLHCWGPAGPVRDVAEGAWRQGVARTKMGGKGFLFSGGEVWGWAMPRWAGPSSPAPLQG